MRVCGRFLRPITLGHLRLLEIIESPFLTGESVGIEDLSAGVAIVSLPLWAAGQAIGRKWLLRLVALPVLWRTLMIGQWHEEAKAFGEFLADNRWMPEMYKKEGDIVNVFEFSSSFSMRLAWLLSGKIGGGVPVKTHPVWQLTVMECLAWRMTDMELSGKEYVTRDEAEKVNDAVAASVAAEADASEPKAVA
jgi:hypothetical protein